MSSDSFLRVYDLRTPSSARYHLVVQAPLHAPGSPPSEALTHDWNKYSDTLLACAGVDRVVRAIDLRRPEGAGPVSVLRGHDFAVRRLAWSPHSADVLASAGYDMTVRVWADGAAADAVAGLPVAEDGAPPREGVQLGIMNRHTEFTTGLDWCLFGEGGWIASVGWDERVLLWDAGQFIRR